jgi:hypothetical protein
MRNIIKCQCGGDLQFEDNSILSNNRNVYPINYCPSCNKMFDNELLVCHNEYHEIKDKRYLSWFTDKYKTVKKMFLEIKNIISIE